MAETFIVDIDRDLAEKLTVMAQARGMTLDELATELVIKMLDEDETAADDTSAPEQAPA